MFYFENDMFPASLINSCHTPPPPPPPNSACLAHSLSSSLPPSLLASLSYVFYSLDPSLSLLSYITLCLTDSPVSLPLPHSLPHSLSHSLPYIALPHPIPSHSPASLIHIFFTQSLPHFPLPNFPALLSPSITPQSLPHYPLIPALLSPSITHCLPHLLPLLLYSHSLPDSLTPLHPNLLTYLLHLTHLLHLIHSSSSLLHLLHFRFIHSSASLFAAPNPFSLPCLLHSLFHHSVIASLSPP